MELINSSKIYLWKDSVASASVQLVQKKRLKTLENKGSKRREGEYRNTKHQTKPEIRNAFNLSHIIKYEPRDSSYSELNLLP